MKVPFRSCYRFYARKGLVGNFDGQDKFKNPIDALQAYVKTPLLRDGEASFAPSEMHMRYAERLFADPFGDRVMLLARARRPDQCPDTKLPEVALLGFSNAGKSSLIRALFHACPQLHVKTSKTPGHTRTVDFFVVHDQFVLVDMPGYGINEPRAFADTVGSYLHVRRRLHTAFLLFNPEQGITQQDVFILKTLESMNINYALILTKIDSFTPSRRLRLLQEVRRLRDSGTVTDNCYAQPFLVSVTGEGIGYLQTFIAHLCGQLRFEL